MKRHAQESDAIPRKILLILESPTYHAWDVRPAPSAFRLAITNLHFLRCFLPLHYPFLASSRTSYPTLPHLWSVGLYTLKSSNLSCKSFLPFPGRWRVRKSRTDHHPAMDGRARPTLQRLEAYVAREGRCDLASARER
jgi:hypothetical protein